VEISLRHYSQLRKTKTKTSQGLQQCSLPEEKATTGAGIIGSGVNGGGRLKPAEHPKDYNAEGLFQQRKP
jgi:hypothetical protein